MVCFSIRFFILSLIQYAGVAQLVEQLIRNQ